MPLTTEQQITLEKSPSYFIDKKVPERVYSLNPKIKLIVVVRNPVTRAISDYTQTLVNHKNFTAPLHSFKDLVMCKKHSVPYDLSINQKHCVNGAINASISLIRIGIYHKHLRNWLEWFPLRNFLFVDGERLITNPAKELNKVERFLGLKSIISENNFTKDAVKGFPCIKDNSTVHCLGKSKGRRHIRTPPEVQKLLREFYKKENEKFFQLINRRFNWD